MFFDSFIVYSYNLISFSNFVGYGFKVWGIVECKIKLCVGNFCCIEFFLNYIGFFCVYVLFLLIGNCVLNLNYIF